MLNSNIKLLSFDLDNTLYDNIEVIKMAELKSRKYLESEFSSNNLEYDSSKFDRIKEQFLQDVCQDSSKNKYQFEDFTHLRYQTNLLLCSPLPNPELVAERALNIFLDYRSKIQVSEAVLLMLENLAKRFRIVSVTNGNCDPMRTKLAHFIERNYSPTQGFRAKPHPEMLYKLMDDFKLDKEQILHIGDRKDADQVAAERAGCHFHLLAPFEENVDETAACNLLLSKLLK